MAGVDGSSEQGTIGSKAGAAYQLTIKRGFLALLVMLGSQIVVGLAFSYGLGFVRAAGTDITGLERYHTAIASVLGGGILTLMWIWSDVRRFGPVFGPQIGLGASRTSIARFVLMVLVGFILIRLFAWGYRAIVLPYFGQNDVVGGATQMFTYLLEHGSAFGLTAFLVLAILVGPIVEEVVYRGYLQSALAKRLPGWVAITLVSLIFTVGHGPAVLWPMYFIFSAAWGWVYFRTGSIKPAIAFHMLNNIYYTLVAVTGWTVLH